MHRRDKFLLTALASIGDGVIITDVQGRVTFLNAVAEELTGWSVSEAAGLPLEGVFRIVNDITRQTVENPVARALREGGIVGLANHSILVAKNGAERPIDDSAAPVRDERQQIVGCVLIFRDITAQRKAERARALLAAIVSDSDDAIVSKTLDGSIVSWNGGAERLYGYTAAEAMGQPIDLIVPPELRDEERTILEQLRNGQRIDHYETTRIASDGSCINVSLTISPLRDEHGRIVGASKVARDITDRKRAEERLREDDRRKDEFIAILAHELRNPLAAICTGIEAMNLASGPAQLGRIRAMMERQSRQLSALVDDLLEISRVTRGKLVLHKTRVTLADIIESAIETAKPAIDDEQHQLSVEVPDEKLEMDGDPHRLSQVLSNLLGNAAKFTPRGGLIRLTLERHGDEALIAVRDSGIGIPAGIQNQIFDMFAQGGHPLDRGAPGLGVGLTVARTLVEMHGGTIGVHSEGAGKGSEFLVRLPLALEPTDDAAPAIASRADPAVTGAQRVLIVDDNDDAAQMLRLLVEDFGSEARTASDGEQAIAVAAEFLPEIVFLDLGMPRMNGYDAARQIRHKSWGRDMMLVALTGWGQEKDRQRIMQAGFDRHLVKPAKPEQLRELLAGQPRRNAQETADWKTGKARNGPEV